MSTYLVTFERIGRNRNPSELWATVANPQDLAAQIYRHARPHLGSKDMEVAVDREAMAGEILCGLRSGGRFTLAEQFVHPELGPMPGYFVGRCGHRVAETEWRAGFRICERCPSKALA